jgi:hypothetical protein
MNRIHLVLLLTTACGGEPGPPPHVQEYLDAQDAKFAKYRAEEAKRKELVAEAKKKPIDELAKEAYELGKEHAILNYKMDDLVEKKVKIEKERDKAQDQLAGLQKVAFILRCLDNKVGKKKAHKIVDGLERGRTAPAMEACKRELQSLTPEQVSTKVSQWVKEEQEKG